MNFEFVMLKNIKHSTTLIVLLLISISSFAQVEFTAASSHTAVKTGDRFQVQFTANAQMENFKAPNLGSSFRVLSGPNQSTQMSWVNGKSSHQISYSYILMAVKEGDFTIGAASAKINGETHKTEPFKVSVGKGVKVNQGGNSSNTNKSKQENVSDDLYIKSSVSKRKVYQGEQIIATYQLYTRVNISGNELVKSADLNGFWSQEIDLGESQWRQEIIGGYRWHIATIRKIVLFPQRSGELEIDPLEMKFIVQRRAQSGGQSVFDQFFGRVENVEYSLKSKPIKITVLPHPTPKPDNFNGAVGNLDMVVDVSTNEIKANEAINIKVKISGKGNINLVEAPVIDFPSDFEVYDPKVDDKTSTTSNGVSGHKEFDFLVIPRNKGTYKLDPIKFSYFNPSNKKYKTITSDPININVLKGEAGSENMVYTGNKEEIKVLGNDIRYIHTKDIKTISANESFYGSVSFYLLMLLAPILFVIAFIFRNRIRVAQSDVVGMKSKKANKIATKLLSTAKQSLAANNKNEFYENVSKALFGYIGDKLNIAPSELNQNNIKDKLIAINASEQTTQDLIDTIELCDMARFAPVAVSEQEVYNKAENIINQIEQEVKS
ncbi:MAG: BatD family protein [Vicingaceae bacterium]|nr:BatD family protein [Vicingaceae bacterium]